MDISNSDIKIVPARFLSQATATRTHIDIDTLDQNTALGVVNYTAYNRYAPGLNLTPLTPQ